MLKLLTGGDVIWEGDLRKGNALLFSDKILACLPNERTEGIEAERIDVAGLCVSPGFVNVHVHGAMGHDLMDATNEAIDGLSLAMAQQGTTAFLPTSITASWKDTEAAVEAVRRGMARVLPGAAVLGMHLEGPWIDVAMKGAHPEAFIGSHPDAGWVADRADAIRTVTFSPTLDPEHRFLRRLLELGIVPSLGHTTAGFEEARSAIEAGAKSITHFFNAQMGLHHRAPGMIGAAAVTNVMCELIADGRHVRSELFAPLCRLIGTERLILITDSMRAAGLPDGDYAFGGGQVLVRDGLPVQPDGTIAGSSLKMNEAIRNFHHATGLPLPEVVGMATRNPSRLLGLSRKGELAAGMDADITCFDENFSVSMTFV
ncbi:MAG: N-acetylglucosamine-6-phosphate deacetylase, partial [Fretibacterium sp.]|nr:N-acetylglucosamine-6-phosphate deacetylase [Fretibacterium sp.]